MRRASILTVLAGLVALPAVALAAKADTSRLSINDGRGLVVLKGRGTVVGRIDLGSVSVVDTTPGDLTEPLVFNCDDETFRGTATVCTGDHLRFRMIGGGWKIVIRGAGIDLSAAVGRGSVLLNGDTRKPGVYSVDGVDCRTEAASCLPLPAEPTTIARSPVEP
jgi:hypothetical protein